MDLGWFGWDTFLFLFLAGSALACTLLMLHAREMVHSAYYLMAVFMVIGGIYIMLGAEYIGVVQWLIYGGAVTVLIIFAIYLTERYLPGSSERGGCK